MKAVVFGPGRIGCGFAGQILRDSGHEVVFVGRDPEAVRRLDRVGGYRVRLVAGRSGHTHDVDGIHALSADQPERVRRALNEADLIVTAVGARNLPAVASFIADGLRGRRTPTNVFAFENLVSAGPYLRRLVAKRLPAGFPLGEHGFSGAIVNRAVTQRWEDPTGREPLTFVGDPISTFVVDGPSLRGTLPAIAGMIVADDYPAWLLRKLYVFSAGHATCAYLGHLKGYRYIHAAIRDPEIRSAVLAAMVEGQRGLSRGYGPDVAGDKEDCWKILRRFENAALGDPVTRVGRDPQRKLGTEDRLIGAARLAAKAGVRPEKLALAAAAAFFYWNSSDKSAVAMHDDIASAGLGHTIGRLTGLDPTRGVGSFVAENCTRLATGWRRGNLLLSLEGALWARG